MLNLTAEFIDYKAHITFNSQRIARGRVGKILLFHSRRPGLNAERHCSVLGYKYACVFNYWRFEGMHGSFSLNCTALYDECFTIKVQAFILMSSYVNDYCELFLYLSSFLSSYITGMLLEKITVYLSSQILWFDACHFKKFSCQNEKITECTGNPYLVSVIVNSYG